MAQITGSEIEKTASSNMGEAMQKLIGSMNRQKWERKWWENTFFDDGFHFKYISKKTGRIIDYQGNTNVSTERAIPRASRQIRGVINLLTAPEPTPVVYPEPVSIAQFKGNQEAYIQAYEAAKHRARRTGTFLSNIWKDYDLGLPLKFIEALLIAAKQSIGYVKIYSPPKKEQLCFETRDAFDLYLYGNYKELEKLPFIIDTTPISMPELKKWMYEVNIDEKKISPDNKYATSEIKDAYMRARYGQKEGEGTFMLQEMFAQECLSEENWERAIKLGADNGALEGKSKGDYIMRHTFAVAGMTLDDEYIDLSSYPYVDVRFEPGYLYQKSLIENFIPQNKSLDIVMTRLESWINAMVVGIYLQRKGENFNISNFPGGYKLQYETTKPEQMQVASAGNTPFNFINLLKEFMDEQGASTAALNQLPQGVKSGVAIEQVKATEYANLKIPTEMLKNSIQRISGKIIELVDKRFVTPHTVYNMDGMEPDYFSIIGSRGLAKRQEVGAEVPEDVVPIKEGTKLRIEIESGMGLTVQGKRETMVQTLDYMIKLAAEGYMTKEAIQLITKKFMDIFGFGSTQEFMEAMEDGTTKDQMNEEDVMKMKVGILEALKEAGQIGPENEERLIQSTKIGTVEAMKDLGLTEGMAAPAQKPPSVSIRFEDLPPEGRAQAAQMAGIQVSPDQFVTDDIRKTAMRKTEKAKPVNNLNS